MAVSGGFVERASGMSPHPCVRKGGTVASGAAAPAVTFVCAPTPLRTRPLALRTFRGYSKIETMLRGLGLRGKGARGGVVAP